MPVGITRGLREDLTMNFPVGPVKSIFILTAGLLLLVAIPTWSDAREARPIKFLTHSLGEQVYMDDSGKLRGRPQGGRRAFYIELVREMMRIMAHPEEIEEVPLKRGLLLVQSGPGYALFNLNRTAERETTVKWVGPLQSSVTHFYENANAPTGIASLEDAKGVESVCVLRGNTHHRFLESQGFKNIFPANSYVSCIDMLVMGRVSVTPLSNLSTLARQQDPADRTLRKTPVKVMESEGYLVFSAETPDAVVKEWQAALDKVKGSGRYDELVELYLGAE